MTQAAEAAAPTSVSNREYLPLTAAIAVLFVLVRVSLVDLVALSISDATVF